MKNLTFKDIMNGMAGLIFQSGGVDHMINSIQVAIVMIGSNPFFG